MRYSTWEPIYEEILKDFGFEREKDEEAARIASEILKSKGNKGEDVKRAIESLIKGKEAIICGNAPCLEKDIREKKLDADTFPFSRDFVIIAADGATSVLLRNAIIPDIVVTDLDGNVADIIYANRLGAIIIAHAHGDNIEKLKKVLPALNENMICTTQSKPLEQSPSSTVYNFGGFTDGDRCVFLAKEFGAKRIELLGFDFEDNRVSGKKKKKLKWAKRLIGDINTPA
ncbi:MAG: DUF115 domain-containing protein [Methanophagales archaeon]|nr:DUF115 domain-containing protein [Methanophagales archaeon]